MTKACATPKATTKSHIRNDTQNTVRSHKQMLFFVFVLKQNSITTNNEIKSNGMRAFVKCVRLTPPTKSNTVSFWSSSTSHWWLISEQAQLFAVVRRVECAEGRTFAKILLEGRRYVGIQPRAPWTLRWFCKMLCGCQPPVPRHSTALTLNDVIDAVAGRCRACAHWHRSYRKFQQRSQPFIHKFRYVSPRTAISFIVAFMTFVKFEHFHPVFD